jgi:CRP/FNR family transcriptional regulator, cyclic AMP receptor protein
MSDIKTLLSRQSFFIGMAPELIDLLASCASVETFAADDYIFHEGHEAENFYLLASGRVNLELATIKNVPIIVETIEPLEALGWSWMFPPYRSKFSAYAIEPVEAIVFNAKCLRALARNNLALGYELLKRVSQVMQERLQTTRGQIIDLYNARV